MPVTDEVKKLSVKEPGIAVNIRFKTATVSSEQKTAVSQEEVIDRPIQKHFDTKNITEPKPEPEPEPEPEPVIKKPLNQATQAQKVTRQNKQPEVKPLPDKKKKTDNESKPSSIAQVASRPQLLEKPRFAAKPTQIHYPRIARKKGYQGRVLVEVSINKNGQQLARVILESSGHDLLDKVALNTIAEWKFKAYQQNGIAVVHRVNIPVNFKLD